MNGVFTDLDRKYHLKAIYFLYHVKAHMTEHYKINFVKQS